MPTLLVVDDEPIICHSFRKVFAREGVRVVTAGTVAEGLRRAAEDDPDVLVLDFQLPDGTGLDLFAQLREKAPRRPVIFLTAHGTTDTAIEAMKRGAFDYLLKPIDLDTMTRLLDRAFEAARAGSPTAPPPDPLGERIVGRSAAIQETSKTIGRLAPQDVNVLIRGESGTGKELVARALHRHGRRADRPFVAINCAALPENLVESELFGHERGAFTGAVADRVGRFEQAADGTILLDEIGDLPLPAQAKMLRLLQEQTFERVGGSRTLTTRARVLAATNQDLEALIAAGKFRGDLFYRLNVVTVHVPPLRDRREDIPELAHHFLHQCAREHDLGVVAFAPEVLDLLQLHPWPGNVRELQGAVKEAALRTAGRTILPDTLPRAVVGRVPAVAPAAGLGETIDRMLRDGGKNVLARVVEVVERESIVRALGHTHGHQSKASELLGINRTTLRNKLRELGITLDKVVAEE